MPAALVLQGPTSVANNDTAWVDIPGLFAATLTRSGPANPATLEASVTYSDQDSAVDSAGDPPLQRWYPYLNLRLVIRDPAVYGAQDVVLWIGRLDHAESKDGGPTSSRYWYLTGRDWLSVLADNSVDTGLWVDAAPEASLPPCPPWIQRFADHQPTNWTKPNPADNQYQPAYLGDYTGLGGKGQYTPTLGEFRYLIIRDLALNTIATRDAHGNLLGLFEVDTSSAPNSREINWTAANVSGSTILQAIATLALSDPWCFLCLPKQLVAGQVDSLLLDAAAYPPNAGIGGEFQIAAYNQGCTASSQLGRIAAYYARGATHANASFVYRSTLPVNGMPPTNWITQFDFAREGLDLFSRMQPLGAGNTKDDAVQTNNPDGSTGVVNVSMEQNWAPTGTRQVLPDGSFVNLDPQYRVRRASINRSETVAGASIYKQDTDQAGAIQARLPNDTALANLVVGATDQADTASALLQGTITLAGPPIAVQPGGPPPTGSAVTAEFMVGYSVYVTIPDLGLSGIAFTMDMVKYVWPDDYTQITLSRVGFSAVRRQLLQLLGRAQDSQAAHANIFTTYWLPAPVAGTLTVRHNLGVQNVKVQIDAAYWTTTGIDITGVPQGKRDPNGNPVPDPGTMVNVPPAGWSANQGQNTGHVIIQQEIDYVTINFNKWLAPSPGAGSGSQKPAWLAADSQNAIIRVTITPR